MRRHFVTVFLVLLSVAAVAQEPSIDNLTFSQRDSTDEALVDIHYDLVSPGGSCTITASLSTDGGVTFPIAISDASGDIGPNVTPGTAKTITWNAWREFPGQTVEAAKVRLMADVSHAPGNSYSIGYVDTAYVDATRANRSVACRIYYPGTSAGQDVPVAGEADTRFPVVVFGHGFVIAIDYYPYIWNNLTPRGYIVVMCNTETTVSPDHTAYGQDLAFLVDALQQDGTNTGSRFLGKVGATAAIMGHSMGGGATLLASQYTKHVETLVTLAAAETSPSAISAASAITIPCLTFTGTADCIAPPATNQIPMHQALASPCKYLLSINNGSHCQFAVDSTICGFGEAYVCPSASYIPAALQQALVLNLVDRWFDMRLKGQASAWTAFQETLDSNIAVNDLASEGTCAPKGLAISPAGSINTMFPGELPLTPRGFALAALGILSLGMFTRRTRAHAVRR